MASREIILRDDDEGKIINHQTQNQDALNRSKGRIGEMEEAVEEFNRERLAEITYDI